MTNIEFQEKDGSVIFNVRVIVRASKSEIVGGHDSALKIKLTSPPVDGAANEELVHLLSKIFAVSRSSVEIISGHTSKTKRVRIDGIGSSQFLSVLKAKS